MAPLHTSPGDSGRLCLKKKKKKERERAKERDSVGLCPLHAGWGWGDICESEGVSLSLCVCESVTLGMCVSVHVLRVFTLALCGVTPTQLRGANLASQSVNHRHLLITQPLRWES